MTLDELPTVKRFQVEKDEKWRELDVPGIHFPSTWAVKIIPPFGGAVARFVVEFCGKSVSVYLDSLDRLGCMRQPYWEIFPAADGDCERFLFGEEEQMVKAIHLGLVAQIDAKPEEGEEA